MAPFIVCSALKKQPSNILDNSDSIALNMKVKKKVLSNPNKNQCMKRSQFVHHFTLALNWDSYFLPKRKSQIFDDIFEKWGKAAFWGSQRS